jgi:thiol:disulfide interchange protein DsbD
MIGGSRKLFKGARMGLSRRVHAGPSRTDPGDLNPAFRAAQVAIRRSLRALIVLLFCLVLPAQKAPSLNPLTDISLLFRDGAVVVEAPAGAHLKRAFMDVKLQNGAAGKLEVGPLPPTNGKDELGDGIWRGPVVIPVKGQGLSGMVAIQVTYQPCTEGDGAVCYPPTDRILQVQASALLAPAPPSRSLFWVFLGVFAAGILASLTPCVYPMIPITMAIVGAKSQYVSPTGEAGTEKGGGKAKGFRLSLMLVLGMALTYTTLGVIAASSGRAFGAFAQHPAFLIPVSIIFALFALSLFGAFEIRLPATLQSRLQDSGPRKGLLGAFLMGLVLGPISAPCVGPVIGTILLAIAAEGRIILGALQLFTFALGMGVLFMAVGTFSASLPRSGPWLVKLKQSMGLVALGFAVWNIRYLAPEWLNQALWTGTLLLAAGVLGAFKPAEGLGGTFLKGLGLLALVIGLFLGLRAVESGLGLDLLPHASGNAVEKSDPWKQRWMEQDFEGALARARSGKKLLVVDVWAEWCAACKELDEKTWPDPGLAAWIAQNAVAVRVDTDKARKDLAQSLHILGYPTVLVLDGDGRILRRREGFQKPEDKLAFLEGR